MFTEYYNATTSYFTQTFGTNFIWLAIVLTTTVSVGYFIFIGYIITHMDKRYFVRGQICDDVIAPSCLTSIACTKIYIIKVAKLVLGLCLLMCGLAMLVLPGQGLITIVIGLSLIPFPGKHKVEISLLSRKSVRTTLNWIRIKANKEPFIFD